MARRNTGPDLHTVMAVLKRDGYRCVRDNAPIQGARGLDFVIHHRRPRAMGGTRRENANSPANLLSLCGPCHAHVESHRAEAFTNGWLVLQNHDPAEVPCLVDHESRWVYLTAESEYSDSPEVAA